MKRAKSENDDDIKPYLSGAYIRSFVKQLGSSTSSSSSTMRERERGVVERETAAAAAAAEAKPQKKQVRRRLQTRKPYQEKLLNMAEARREIVTALKLHRASMKHQQEILDHQKPRRNPRIYASDSAAAAAPYLSLPPLPPPVFLEGLDFALPSQALGLNLNLHDFVTVPSSAIYSSSSTETTSSSSPPPPPPPLLPRPVAGEGERFEFLNVGVEINGGEEEEREEEVVSSPFDFDEVMEFPPWLNANESCLHHVDDFFQGSVLPW